jgi:hypothetical protein
MKLDIARYNNMLANQCIMMIYSGPLWVKEMEGMAEMVQNRLDLDDMPLSVSQSVFSIFVEQMNNMMMYSAQTERFKQMDVPCGVLLLGTSGKEYFIQSGNMMHDRNVPLLVDRLDYLNTLDKKELRQHYKMKIRETDDNPDSKGAGVGLIEIARRAKSKIEYEITPGDNGLSYFTMYVTV